MRQIPTIDIAPFLHGGEADRRRVGAAVDAACREIGFLSIVGHGVPMALIERARQVTRAFFELPLERKLAHVPPKERKGMRGYRSVGQESLARSLGVVVPPDLRETFRIGHVDPGADDYARRGSDSYYAPNLWPDEIAGFRETWESYYRAFDTLSGQIMEIFAVALGLPQDFFADKVNRHIAHLQGNHYPPLKMAPKDGQWRASAHSDYGSLTILWQEKAVGGLQVLNADKEWVDVATDESGFVVNIGDMMAFWTNDRWVSTVHRVGLPPVGPDSRSRLSFAYFHVPNFDAVVKCIPTCCSADNPPRYSETTSGQYLLDKIRRANQIGDAYAAQAAV